MLDAAKSQTASAFEARIVKEKQVAAPILRTPSRSAGARISMILLAAVLGVAGCSKPVEKAEDIRPVRVVKVAAGSVSGGSEFSGEVRARVESRLGFRVGGKIVSRKVDLGASVRRGQVLMQLDPRDLQLAQAQASAGLKAAESNRDLARAELKRYQELREKNFVSQAVLDSKETAFRSAQASHDQALAAFRNQSNQAGYADLVADADGVVTGVDAEVGQVVAAGTPVVRVAQLGEKEVVIGIPEDQVDALRKASHITIRTWARSDRSYRGKLRELSPIADPATRTYAARITIPEASEDVRLGMTAYVSFEGKSGDNAIHLPLTALHKDKAGTSVWVVENGAVKQVQVQVSGTSGNEVVVSGGLAPGQTVVTAGVNQLRPGQKVKLLGEEAVAANGAVK